MVGLVKKGERTAFPTSGEAILDYIDFPVRVRGHTFTRADLKKKRWWWLPSRRAAWRSLMGRVCVVKAMADFELIGAAGNSKTLRRFLETESSAYLDSAMNMTKLLSMPVIKTECQFKGPAPSPARALIDITTHRGAV